jgi:hypothetical protein
MQRNKPVVNLPILLGQRLANPPAHFVAATKDFDLQVFRSISVNNDCRPDLMQWTPHRSRNQRIAILNRGDSRFV